MDSLEELKKKYEELGKEIERLEKEKKNKRWRARYDGEYFFVNSECMEDNSTEWRDETDDARHQIGNYFKTREDAQKVANKIKTYVELKQLAEELNGDEKISWLNCFQTKYYINYAYCYDDFRLEGANAFKSYEIYCLDKNFLDKALEQIGEERLKELFK